jgi:cellulose biosynthesis protein BcsQ
VVFISHSHDDRAFVEKTIRPLLLNNGIQPFFSGEIPGGGRWEKEILRKLNDCDWFMVVMSPRAAASEWVRKEVTLAFLHKRGRILPVLLEKCDRVSFHEEMPELHFVDFTQNRERAQWRVISSMLRLLDRENRELQEKIHELSEDNVRLKEENQALATDLDQQRGQLRSAELFDGNWVVLGRGEVPPFRPLAERKTPIIALMNLKGGVGKTTLTANLGATLWREPFQRRVLLVDLDYQASLTKICLDPSVFARLRVREHLSQRFFSGNEVPEPRLVLQCAQPIMDRKKESAGHIVATDENLAPVEVHAQGEWLLGKRQLDVRYGLRKLLHADVVCREYQVILLDCPPRLTTGCINALTCCDFLLIPVTPEDISTEGVPRLLSWVRERKDILFPGLTGVGVVANRTRGGSIDSLVNREKELWANLQHQCDDAWKARVPLFQTVVPMFPEVAMSHQFPASHRDFRGLFQHLVQELMQHLKIKQETKA